MDFLADIVLKAGRSAVELSLFVLLPVMVVMLSIMRLLESRGILDAIVHRIAPLMRPFGLTGFGVFAMLQINFVSFAAPIATLTMMEQRGVSDRQLAATLAMVMAMSQANVVLPMATMGLHVGFTLLLSLLGGLLAATVTWYGFARHLSGEDHVSNENLHQNPLEKRSVLDVINHAGAEAFKIAIGSIPMLVLSLVIVTALRRAGAIDALGALLAPALGLIGLDSTFLLPALTKYLAGGTAMMGVMVEMFQHAQTTTDAFNRAAGFLITPFDLPGVAILITAGKRVAQIWKPAALGAIIGIALRTTAHAFWG